LLLDLSLQFFTQLLAGQRPVDEGRWLFLVKFEQLLPPLGIVVVRKKGVGLD